MAETPNTTPTSTTTPDTKKSFGQQLKEATLSGVYSGLGIKKFDDNKSFSENAKEAITSGIYSGLGINKFQQSQEPTAKTDASKITTPKENAKNVARVNRKVDNLTIAVKRNYIEILQVKRRLNAIEEKLDAIKIPTLPLDSAGKQKTPDAAAGGLNLNLGDFDLLNKLKKAPIATSLAKILLNPVTLAAAGFATLAYYTGKARREDPEGAAEFDRKLKTGGARSQVIQGPEAEREKFKDQPLPERKLSPTELLKKLGVTKDDVKSLRGNIITLKDGRKIDTTKQDFIKDEIEPTPGSATSSEKTTTSTSDLTRADNLDSSSSTIAKSIWFWIDAGGKDKNLFNDYLRLNTENRNKVNNYYLTLRDISLGSDKSFDLLRKYIDTLEDLSGLKPQDERPSNQASPPASATPAISTGTPSATAKPTATAPAIPSQIGSYAFGPMPSMPEIPDVPAQPTPVSRQRVTPPSMPPVSGTTPTMTGGTITPEANILRDKRRIGRGGPSADVSDAMERAAKDLGVDPRIIWGKASVESGYKPGARAGISSATGLGQFLTGTWSEVAKYPEAKKFGITGDPNERLDPYKSAVASYLYSQRNIENLKKQGLVTDEQLKANPGLYYVPHNLGPAGARRFFQGLRDNPDAPVSQFLTPTEIRNNPSIYAPGGRVLSAREALGNIESGRFGEGVRRRQSLAEEGKLPGFEGQPTPGAQPAATPVAPTPQQTTPPAPATPVTPPGAQGGVTPPAPATPVTPPMPAAAREAGSRTPTAVIRNQQYGAGSLAEITSIGGQLGGVGQITAGGPRGQGSLRGLCGKGTRGVTGALLNDSYFGRGMGGNAESLSRGNRYLQKSGLYDEPMALSNKQMSKEYLDSLPIGTVISSTGGSKGYGHVQVKGPNGTWISDGVQTKVLTNNYSNFVAHLPNEKGLQRLNPNIVNRDPPTLAHMQQRNMNPQTPTPEQVAQGVPGPGPRPTPEQVQQNQNQIAQSAIQQSASGAAMSPEDRGKILANLRAGLPEGASPEIKAARESLLQAESTLRMMDPNNKMLPENQAQASDATKIEAENQKAMEAVRASPDTASSTAMGAGVETTEDMNAIPESEKAIQQQYDATRQSADPVMAMEAVKAATDTMSSSAMGAGFESGEDLNTIPDSEKAIQNQYEAGRAVADAIKVQASSTTTTGPMTEEGFKQLMGGFESSYRSDEEAKLAEADRQATFGSSTTFGAMVPDQSASAERIQSEVGKANLEAAQQAEIKQREKEVEQARDTAVQATTKPREAPMPGTGNDPESLPASPGNNGYGNKKESGDMPSICTI